jgi:hypothetical protein
VGAIPASSSGCSGDSGKERILGFLKNYITEECMCVSTI